MIKIFLSIVWLIQLIYWAISARKVKADAQIENSVACYLKAKRIVILIIILQLLPLDGGIWFFESFESGLVWGMIGMILCILGVSFAIWARAHLGENWSGPPSVKNNHKLVTTGPYRIVRHPIYTGLLSAFLGSAIIGIHLWVIGFIGCCLLFIVKVKIEEELMSREFPSAYQEYKEKTKMLVPFLI